MVESPELEFIGAYDIRPERTANLPGGGKAYSSLEELLADDRIELVTIATPNDVHKEIAVKALQAGKNVISEKPVTLSSADLEEMIAAAEKAGRLFTVHQNRRWDPDYLTIKNIFDKKVVGNVFCIESRVHGSRGIPGDWRNQKEHGGGMVLDWGIHIIDQMLMMTLPRKVVSVYAHLDYVTNENCDDGFHIETVFDDGLVYRTEVGTSNFIALPRWYVLGDNGSAIIRNWKLEGEIVMVSDWENRDAVPIIAGVGLTKTMAPRTDDTIKHYPIEKVGGDWRDFYRNVCAAIRGEADLIVTHAQQRRLVKLLETVFESAARNEVVKLSL
jgi:predicted dehydrogenase